MKEAIDIVGSKTRKSAEGIILLDLDEGRESMPKPFWCPLSSLTNT